MKVSHAHSTLDTAIASQPEREQKLLAACAVCGHKGFWLLLAAQVQNSDEGRRYQRSKAAQQ